MTQDEKIELLTEALRGILKLIDDQDLVRNTDKDAEITMFMRQGMRINHALGLANQALESGKVLEPAP